jgi:hypothetical protein
LAYQAAGGRPGLDGDEFVVEDVGGGVCFGLEGLVEGIDDVIWVSVDNPDEGRGARVIVGEHHVEVDLAGLALDVYFEDALDFDVPAGLSVFGWVLACVLNMRMSGVRKG